MFAVSKPSVVEFPALECWPFGPSHFSSLETLSDWMISYFPLQETLWCHNSTADLLLLGQMVVPEFLGHFASIPTLYGPWGGGMDEKGFPRPSSRASELMTLRGNHVLPSDLICIISDDALLSKEWRAAPCVDARHEPSQWGRCLYGCRSLYVHSWII